MNGDKDRPDIFIVSNSTIFFSLIAPNKPKKEIVIVYGLTFLYRLFVGNDIGNNPIVLELECIKKIFYVSSQS
jgi:hypothetical protein